MDLNDLMKGLDHHCEKAIRGQLQAVVLPTDSGFLPKDLEGWCIRRALSMELYRHAHLQDSFLPYDPFASWLRHSVAKDPQVLDHDLETSGVYSLHRNLFRSWLEGKKVQRPEILIPQEAAFEQENFRHALHKLLQKRLFGAPALVILEQAQHLGRGTLEVLREMVAGITDCPVMFLLTVRLGREDSEEEREFWSGFWEIWEDRKLGAQVWSSGLREPSFRKLDLRDPGDVLDRMELLMECFCWNDAQELGRRISESLAKNPGVLDPEQSRRFHQSAGELALRQGDGTGAQTHWSHLLTLPESAGSRTGAWLKMAWAAAVIRDRREMDPWLEKLQEQQRGGLLTPRDHCFLGFLRLWAENLEPRLDFAEWKTLYRETLSQGQDLELINTTAFWLVNPFRMTSLESLGEASYFQDWGMEVCEKLGNTLRLSDAYLVRGHFCALQGDWDKVLDAYKKAEDLKVSLGGNPGELAAIHNGRGFFLMETGNFTGAQDSFYRALDCLKHRTDFKEIALTLFNLGTNFFRAGNWAKAETCLSSLLKLMHLLDMKNLVFHSRKEVLVLSALVWLKLDQPLRAYDLWLRIQGAEESLKTEAELVWYWILAGWIRLYEGDLAKAQASFIEGRNLLGPEKQYLQFTAPYFWYELGMFFSRSGKKEDALLAFRQGYQASFQFPNFYIRSLLDSALNPGKGLAAAVDLGPLRMDFDWFIEAGRSDKALRLARSRNHSLETLRQLITLLSGDSPEDDLLAESVNLLQRSFYFDHQVLHRFQSGGWSRIIPREVSGAEGGYTEGVFMEHLRESGIQGYLPDPGAHPQLVSLPHSLPAFVSVLGDFRGEYGLHFLGLMPPHGFLLKEDVETLNLGISLLTTHLGRKSREADLEKQLTEMHRKFTGGK